MGKPRGIKTARKIRTHRRVQRWADKDYKKAHSGTGRSPALKMNLYRDWCVLIVDASMGSGRTIVVPFRLSPPSLPFFLEFLSTLSLSSFSFASSSHLFLLFILSSSSCPFLLSSSFRPFLLFPSSCSLLLSPSPFLLSLSSCPFSFFLPLIPSYLFLIPPFSLLSLPQP